MPPQSHIFPLQQQQEDVQQQQQQQQQEEQPQNETERRINELLLALEESRKQMSVIESEMQKKFTSFLKQSEQKQKDVESSTVKDLRRQVSDMAKEMQKMKEVFVRFEQKKSDNDVSKTVQDLQRKMSDMEKKMQEQAESHEKERVQWEEKWDSMASQIGLLRIYMTSGRNSASNINNQKQSMNFDSSSKKVSSSSEKPKDDKDVMENQQSGRITKAQLFHELCQYRLRSKEKKAKQPDPQTSDKVINEFMNKIYSTRSVHPKLLKKELQKKSFEAVQSSAEIVSDGDSEKQSSKSTNVTDEKMPSDNKSPITLRLKPATMDFSVNNGAIPKYTLQMENPTAKVNDSSTNELKMIARDKCSVTLELTKYKDGIEQNIAHVVEKQCRCKTDDKQPEATMIKVPKVHTEDKQKDLEAKNEEESLARKLSEKLKLQGTTLVKCDNGDKEIKGTNEITTETEKDVAATNKESSTKQTAAESNEILIKMNAPKDQTAHVFSLALQESFSQMSRMQDQIQKLADKYDTERKHWEDEKRTTEFQLKRLQARHQVLPPEVELQIESYKREHKIVFAWDVREKLIEEGYCNRQNAPSVSAISKILKDL